jgi:hypothetical protein
MCDSESTATDLEAHQQLTNIECPVCEAGYLVEDGYEKYCHNCYTVEYGDEYRIEYTPDRVKQLWQERKQYRNGEKSGRPYVFGSWTRR